MKQSILAFVFALLFPLAGCNSNRSTQAAPDASSPAATTASASPQTARSAGGFDFYLLNLSWSPEFCRTNSSAAECSLHPAFILHGLWPENNNGSYPEKCSTAPGPADPAQYADIYPDQGLLQHEWLTHGTCSGLGPNAFFSAARAAFHAVKIPASLISLRTPTCLPPNQILAGFVATNPGISQSSLVLSCGNNYLTAVEVCLDKSFHAVACGTLRSCRANTVRITPP
jgi:ribonuclease T2